MDKNLQINEYKRASIIFSYFDTPMLGLMVLPWTYCIIYHYILFYKQNDLIPTTEANLQLHSNEVAVACHPSG